MTGRVRRRRTRERAGLTSAERRFLRSGHITVGDSDVAGFHVMDAGVWRLDVRAARAAWRASAADVWADTAPGLVPWAARVFDGAEGHSSHWCHLGDPTCHGPSWRSA